MQRQSVEQHKDIISAPFVSVREKPKMMSPEIAKKLQERKEQIRKITLIPDNTNEASKSTIQQDQQSKKL